HADDDERFAEPMFQLPQLREEVHAVDSAVSPEVEEHDLAPEPVQPERFAPGIQPVEPLLELRRTYDPDRHGLASALLSPMHPTGGLPPAFFHPHRPFGPGHRNGAAASASPSGHRPPSERRRWARRVPRRAIEAWRRAHLERSPWAVRVHVHVHTRAGGGPRRSPSTRTRTSGPPGR